MTSNWTFLFVAGSLLFVTTQIAAEEHAVLGQGNVSCGSWLDDRAEQIKALSEAGALRERERILQIVFDALSSALRSQHGQPATSPVVKTLAEKFPTANPLRRLDALETLRRRLASGVQEALALESGFLEMICPGSSCS